MNKKTLLVSGLAVLLISCVLMSGCTDNSSTKNTTTQTSVVTTSPSGSAKYVSGDIVKIPSSSAATAMLIIGYDAATDTYERALIYPNADGSWGYRRNSNTEKAARAAMEKAYTEKITNKPLSSIVIRQPTVLTTTTVRSTTQATSTSTTTTTTTTTVSPTGKPTFKKIDPDFGDAGTAISITSLTGSNFQSGATVTLRKSDNPNITATNVNVHSSTWITCTFNPPANASAGTWDVVITNPDGQYVSYSNIFSIHGSTSTATTTSPTGSGGITSISPTSTIGNDVTGGMQIIGTDFQQGFTAKMTKTTGTAVVIEARSVRWDSPTQVTAWFTIPTPRQRGFYNVIVTNPDGSTRTLANAFEVK
jgi:hypothetical protein